MMYLALYLHWQSIRITVTVSLHTNNHPPAQPQPDIAATAIQLGSNVRPNPHLGIGSRIQLPTNHSNEPFKYGVIRWIGEMPQLQGAVAGIELVSDLFPKDWLGRSKLV